MKVYVHYEGDKPLTMSLGGPDVANMTCQQVLQKFLLVYRKENPATAVVDTSQIQLVKSGSKKALPVGSKLINKVKDKDDLFIQFISDGNSQAGNQTEGTNKAPVKSNNEQNPTKKNMEEKQLKLTTLRGCESKDQLLKEGEKYMESGLLNRAVIVFKQALLLEPSNEKVMKYLVKIYLDAGRSAAAREYSKKLKDTYPANEEYIFKYAECLLADKEADLTIDTLKEYTSTLRAKATATKEQKHKTQLLMCHAYQLKNQRDMAIVVIQGVANEDRENLPALVEFADLTYGLGDLQSEEAMTILLTALVYNKDSKPFKEKFASVCQRKDGLKYLKKVAGDIWQKASVAAFLATTLRDFGAVTEALSLFEHALHLEPNHANIFLTYIHTLELLDKHTTALTEVCGYLRRNRQRKIAGVPIESFLGCLPQNCADIYMLKQPTDSLLELTEHEVTADTYSDEDLNILAIMFTLVKILYVKGALDYIPMLIMQLEPLAQGKELHTTVIRNEAAYFGCIQKIISLNCLPASPHLEEDFIYFVGDSHCISPAWRSITYKRKECRLHPVLSTGTKIWHLRPGAKFYPKVNFEHSVRIVPKKALVIFAFGEIDCREAMLLCVEKCKYDNLEEAMDRVIDIYITLLKQLIEKNQWTIFVHPVCPVLDVTRKIVLKFNERLKICVDEEPKLKWLNFLENLLNKDQSQLLSTYNFDETHLHPCYVELIEKSLNSS